jgi:hypothetical protein
MASFCLTPQITIIINNLIKMNTYYISYPSLLYNKTLTYFTEIEMLESAKGIYIDINKNLPIV